MARRFREAAQAGSVELVTFLPPVGDPLRRAAFFAIIREDLGIRWQRGQKYQLETYLKRFPELGSHADVPSWLIYEEYRVRESMGERPLPESYEQRFPKQFAQFKELLHLGTTRAAPLSTRTGAPAIVGTPAASVGRTADFSVTPGASLDRSGTGTVDVAVTPGAPPFVAPVPAKQVDTSSGLHGYKLLQRLGSGSFAEVWQGEAPGGFRVAIKRIMRPLDDVQAQRELHSLNQMKALNHIFLLQNHAYFLVDNYLYVVMELAEGTLRDRMKECQRQGKPTIPMPETVRYFREAAEALDYMHSQNVLHRDIKPQNILIANGHAKVADFGLALLLESQRALLSASGSGTPAYMAPEVWKRKVSPHSDQYSLAFAYAEQRLGHWPFESRDLHGLMLDHLETDPKLDGLPAAEQEVLRKALAKNPAERFASCSEFMRATEEALAEELGHSALRRPVARLSETIEMPRSEAPDGRTNRVFSGGNSATEELPSAIETPVPGARLARGLKIAALLLLLMAGGIVAWHFLPRQPSIQDQPLLQLIEPGSLSLRAGEAKTVRLLIKRNGFDGDVAVAFENVPANCLILPETIAAGKQFVEVKVLAAPDATPGRDQRVTVRATGVDVTSETVLDLNIEPPLRPWKDWHKPEGARLVEHSTNRVDYDRLEVVRDAKDKRIHVPFVLVRRTQDKDPATFYIMEDKVWVDLFRAYESQPGTNLASEKWKTYEVDRKQNKDAKNPILGVVAVDADRCAQWLGGLLPTPKQWDKAAGCFEKGVGIGPFGKSFKLDDLGLDGKLLPLDAPTTDISWCGARHMSANGLEWTGSDAELGTRTSDRTESKSLATVEFLTLRGASFNDQTPLTFETLAKSVAPSIAMPTQDTYSVGFRVVRELER
ncbi:MAG: protein kinase [Gemmataceae bacterium]|nr:protein kinase [Gemmataceae bacterium]